MRGTPCCSSASIAKTAIGQTTNVRFDVLPSHRATLICSPALTGAPFVRSNAVPDASIFPCFRLFGHHEDEEIRDDDRRGEEPEGRDEAIAIGDHAAEEGRHRG